MPTTDKPTSRRKYAEHDQEPMTFGIFLVTPGGFFIHEPVGNFLSDREQAPPPFN